MQTQVSQHYIDGIKEGRDALRKYGTEQITVAERIANLKSTMKGFSNTSPVGEMLRGELDFWKNQAK